MTSFGDVSQSLADPLSSASAQTAAQSASNGVSHSNNHTESAEQPFNGSVSPNPQAQISEDVLQPLRNYQNFLLRYNLSEKNVRSQLLYQVHEDLLLMRGWTCVRVVHSEDGLISYITGQAQAALDSVFPHAGAQVDRTQAVVPVCVSDRLTPQILHGFTTKCVHPCTKQPLRCVTMAIVDADSTTAYYRVFGTLEEIVHPQWKMKRASKGDAAGEADDTADEEASEEDEDDDDDEEHSGEHDDDGDGDDDGDEDDHEKDRVLK